MGYCIMLRIVNLLRVVTTQADPAGRSVDFYAAPKGERVPLSAGPHRLGIARESWAQLVGLSRDELLDSLQPIEGGE